MPPVRGPRTQIVDNHYDDARYPQAETQAETQPESQAERQLISTKTQKIPGRDSDLGFFERAKKLAQLQGFGRFLRDFGQQLRVVIEALTQRWDHIGQLGFPVDHAIREAATQQFDHNRGRS